MFLDGVFAPYEVEVCFGRGARSSFNDLKMVVADECFVTLDLRVVEFIGRCCALYNDFVP